MGEATVLDEASLLGGWLVLDEASVIGESLVLDEASTCTRGDASVLYEA